MESIRHRILKGTIYNVLGTVLMLVIGVGASVLFVRYLGDRDYGVAVYLADLSLMAVVICSLGLGTYQAKELPRLKAEGRLAEYKFLLIHNAKLRLVFLLVFIAGLRLAQAAGLADLLKIDGTLFYFLSLFALLQLALAFLRGPLQIEYQQKFLNGVDVGFLVGRVLLVLPVIQLDLGLAGFLWTEVLVELGQLALLALRFKRLVWDPLRRVAPVPFRGAVLRTSVPMFIVDFSTKFFGKETDTIFLGLLSGASAFSAVSAYSLSYVLVMRAFSFLGLGTSSAATLLMNSSAEMVSTGNGHLLEKLIEKQLKMLALLVLPITTGGIILGESMLRLLYGNMFAGKGVISGVIFLGVGLTSVSYVARPILFVLEKERALVSQRLAVALLKVLLFLALVPSTGILGAAVCSIGTLVLVSYLELRLLCSLIRVDIPWRFVSKSAAGSILMALAVILMQQGALPLSVPRLLVLVLAGALVYLASMFLFKPFSKSDCDSLSGIRLFGVLDVKRWATHFSSGA